MKRQAVVIILICLTLSGIGVYTGNMIWFLPTVAALAIFVFASLFSSDEE